MLQQEVLQVGRPTRIEQALHIWGDVMTMGTAEQLRAFVLENFLFGDQSRIPAGDASLLGNGVIDSTGVLELIEFLEEEFGIAVDDSETVPENLDTFDGLERFVGFKQGGNEGAA